MNQLNCKTQNVLLILSERLKILSMHLRQSKSLTASEYRKQMGKLKRNGIYLKTYKDIISDELRQILFNKKTSTLADHIQIVANCLNDILQNNSIYDELLLNNINNIIKCSAEKKH